MSQVGDILSEIQAHVIADTSVDFDEHRVFLRYPDPREARQKPVLFIFPAAPRISRRADDIIRRTLPIGIFVLITLDEGNEAEEVTQLWDAYEPIQASLEKLTINRMAKAKTFKEDDDGPHPFGVENNDNLIGLLSSWTAEYERNRATTGA